MPSPVLRPVTVHLTEDHLAKLDALASQRERSRSWMLRHLIDKAADTPSERPEPPPNPGLGRKVGDAHQHRWTQGVSGVVTCDGCGQVKR